MFGCICARHLGVSFIARNMTDPRTSTRQNRGTSAHNEARVVYSKRSVRVSFGMAIISHGAQDGVYEKMTELLDRLPRGRLLDLPAGHGDLSAVARDLGFQVRSADLDPSVFRAEGLTCDAADMNAPLPYEDGTFDVAICAEGIEHIQNPYLLARELRRVLVKGGNLVLTTQNVLSLPSRLRFLLTGLPSYFDYHWTLQQWGHIAPIGAPELILALSRAGFTIEEITTSRVTTMAKRLRPLGPLVRMASRKMVMDSSLRELTTDENVLFGEILFVRARAGGPPLATDSYPFEVPEPLDA